MSPASRAAEPAPGSSGPPSNRSRPRSAPCCSSAAQAPVGPLNAHPAGPELALLSRARRRRQIQPPADGGAGRARPACRVVARIGVFGERGARAVPRRNWRRAACSPEFAGRAAWWRSSARASRSTWSPTPTCAPISPIADRRLSVPIVILASTDDPAQLLLEAALRAEHRAAWSTWRAPPWPCPSAPIAPSPARPRPSASAAADGVVGVSQYVADYIRRYGGIDAVHVPISLLEPGDWPALGRFENEFVTMVNPCAVKGIAIFLALADAFPEVASPPCPPGAPTPRTGPRWRRTPTCGCSTRWTTSTCCCAAPRAAGAVAVGRGAVADRARGHAARRAGDGQQRRRHSRGEDGRALPAARDPHRDDTSRAWTSRWCRWPRCRRRNRPLARGASPPAHRPRRTTLRSLAEIARGGAGICRGP